MDQAWITANDHIWNRGNSVMFRFATDLTIATPAIEIEQPSESRMASHATCHLHYVRTRDEGIVRSW